MEDRGLVRPVNSGPEFSDTLAWLNLTEKQLYQINDVCFYYILICTRVLSKSEFIQDELGTGFSDCNT